MRTNSLSAIAALVALLAACAPSDDVRAPASPAALPFIVDDYSTALAEARTRKLPIFIESWAPW